MKAIASFGLIPVFACWLCAAPQAETNATTTTTTTYDGTLLDAGCHNTRTEHHESSTTSNPETGSSTTTNSSSTRTSSECPVTTTTTSFGLLTPEGHYISFDSPSNQRIIEYVKSHRKHDEPVKVKIVGSRKGDVVVMDTIQ